LNLKKNLNVAPDAGEDDLDFNIDSNLMDNLNENINLTVYIHDGTSPLKYALRDTNGISNGFFVMKMMSTMGKPHNNR
jgi:hypothetical protein